MTGEPMHTTSKEWMVPELMFSSQHAPQLTITESYWLESEYTLVSAMFSSVTNKEQ